MWTSPSLSLTKDCSFSERETRAEKLCPKIELKFSVSPAVLLYGKCLHLFGRGTQTLQEFCSTTPRASFHARRKLFWHNAAMSKIHYCPEKKQGNLTNSQSLCALHNNCHVLSTFGFMEGAMNGHFVSSIGIQGRKFFRTLPYFVNQHTISHSLSPSKDYCENEKHRAK